MRKFSFLTKPINLKNGLSKNGYFNIHYEKQDSVIELFDMIDNLDNYFNNLYFNDLSYSKVCKVPSNKHIKIKFSTNNYLKDKKCLSCLFFKKTESNYNLIDHVSFDNINKYLKYGYNYQFLITLDSLWSNKREFGINFRCSKIIMIPKNILEKPLSNLINTELIENNSKKPFLKIKKI